MPHPSIGPAGLIYGSKLVYTKDRCLSGSYCEPAPLGENRLAVVRLHCLLQVETLITELAEAGSAALGVQLDEGTLPRLSAYAKSVAHFPTAVKEASFSALLLFPVQDTRAC